MNKTSVLLLALAVVALVAPHQGFSQRQRFKIDFVTISFEAPREMKGVSFAVLTSASDATLKQRFDQGRLDFEQLILELNMAKGPTPSLSEAFSQQALVWTAIGEDATVPAPIRGAALHNAANCYTVSREYGKALASATAAATADPKERRYSAERDGIRNGFYLNRTGYRPVEVAGIKLNAISIPSQMDGIATGLEVSPPRALVTPYRTVKDALGMIWVNGRKKYSVGYHETVVMDNAPLVGTLTLHNRTERVVDCSKLVVQTFLNGNPFGGPAVLKWAQDPVRVLPNGNAIATFSVIRPQQLTDGSTLTISVFDVPSAVNETGVVEAKRNDSFTWNVQSAVYSFEVVQKVVEELVTEEDAAIEGRAVAGRARYEPFVKLAK